MRSRAVSKECLLKQNYSQSWIEGFGKLIWPRTFFLMFSALEPCPGSALTHPGQSGIKEPPRNRVKGSTGHIRRLVLQDRALNSSHAAGTHSLTI